MSESTTAGDYSSVAYTGRRIGCTWCSYETRGAGRIPLVPIATRALATPKGPREVCAEHAVARTWRRRERRVAAVAC